MGIDIWIFYVPKEQGLGWHRRARHATVFSFNDRAETRQRQFSPADIDKSPDNRPDHIPEKAVGGNCEYYAVATTKAPWWIWIVGEMQGSPNCFSDVANVGFSV